MLRNMAAAVGQLSPDMLLGLLSDDAGSADEARGHGRGRQPHDRRDDRRTSSRSNVIASSGTPTDRLAQAFQTLVREPDDRQRLLTSRTTTSRRRRSAAPKASRRCGTTSRRSC